MAEGNNQGRALLRILREATQMIDVPSDARQDVSTLQEFTMGTFPSALPTTHVRGAAAGEQQEDAQSLPTVSYVSESPCPLPRPGASAAVPLRSSGADPLARLQGAPTSTVPTMTCQQWQQPQHQDQYWHVQQQCQHDHPPPRGLAPAEAPQRYLQQQQQYHQHQHQYQHQFSYPQQQQQQQQQQYASLPVPPTVTTRSIAAEQERFLKKFLSIESPETESRSSIFSPAPPLSPTPSLPTSAAMSTPAASESGGGGDGDARSSTSRAKDRGKGRGPRGGPTRGGGGGNGGTEDSAMTSSTPKREPSKRSVSSGRRNTEASNRDKGGRKGRGARSHNELGSRESKKGWKSGGTRNGGGGGGGGGGRGGGRSKVLSPSPPATPAYALSSFQNSPDPKNIPIPSLSHLSLSSDVSAGDEGLVPEETVTNCRDDMVVEDEVLHMPPPLPPQLAEGCARTEGEARSAAKRAEDDIKRMLRLG